MLCPEHAIDLIPLEGSLSEFGAYNCLGPGWLLSFSPPGPFCPSFLEFGVCPTLNEVTVGHPIHFLWRLCLCLVNHTEEAALLVEEKGMEPLENASEF